MKERFLRNNALWKSAFKKWNTGKPSTNPLFIYRVCVDMANIIQNSICLKVNWKTDKIHRILTFYTTSWLESWMASKNHLQLFCPRGCVDSESRLLVKANTMFTFSISHFLGENLQIVQFFFKPWVSLMHKFLPYYIVLCPWTNLLSWFPLLSLYDKTWQFLFR